ncbi:MAG: hypothetical protein ACJAVM_001627 [Sulfitobacter sp.]|jgi:hypothetical protein
MRIIVLVLVLLGQVAVAAGPENSKRPVQRGGNVMPVVKITPDGSLQKPKPDMDHGIGFVMQASLRPQFRPQQIEIQAKKQRRLLRKGAVCGDIAIQGEAIGRVKAKLKGCGVENAVRVRSVSGVTLSQTSVMDCRTAKSLKKWLDRTAKPALSRKGGGLRSLRVAAHYSCRTRNNKKGAKISEHGKGRAIDISAFRLNDGSEMTVLHGWNARGSKKALRKMHRGACGPFKTVLGPQADRYHRDHFHFDTAQYRGGAYCR